MHLPPLKSIVAFEVVARLGSVNRAADEMNVTASAVSHQLANLESFVGRKLFERSPRGLTLTPVGERFLRDITGALATIASAAQNARDSEGVEVLRVHAAPSFASLWLMPRLPALRTAHPDLRIQLSASHTYSDFSRGEVDVDIRDGAFGRRDLHIETIFADEEILPLASPELLRQSPVASPQDLLAKPLILSTIQLVQWPRWFAAHGVPMSPGTWALEFDRAYMVIDAAARGLGIALERSRLSEQLVAEGTLVPVFPDRKAVTVHAHHFVYPPSHGEWTKVERFVSWVKRQAALPGRQVRGVSRSG